MAVMGFPHWIRGRTILATRAGRQQAIADSKKPAGVAAGRHVDLELERDEP
jgi:hypothetical protein